MAEGQGHMKPQGRQGVPTIYDCFDSFKTTEQLDENNTWYCK